MSCVVLVRIPRWQRQHFTAGGSREDAAARLPWAAQGVQGWIRSDAEGMEMPRLQQRVQFSARAGLCSGSPGPGGRGGTQLPFFA